MLLYPPALRGVPMKPTRRSFLQGAGVVAAAAFAPTLPAAAAENPPALPAPIAKLNSRKSEAKGITPAEREQRIERARELMRANKLDAVFLAGGTSLNYFSGISWWLSERLFAMVLPV